MSYEAIKKALEGVTPGPWELCAHLKHNDACSCGYRGVIYGPEPDGFAICQPGHEPAPEGQEGTEPPRYPRGVEIANMRYIAAVNPEAISELLSTLESLQRENEELRRDLSHEASHRQKLQNALAYWMPGVTEEIEISTNGRCGDDALLLVGSDGPFEDKCWGNEAIARAEAAEAEVRLIREAACELLDQAEHVCLGAHTPLDIKEAARNLADPIGKVQAALASTGGEDHAE